MLTSNTPTLSLLKYIAVMNYMFNTASVIGASILACRLFVSLSRYLKQDAPPSARPPLPAGGDSQNVGQVRLGGIDGDSSFGTIAKTAFRIMGEGIDSMGQVYSMDGLTTTASAHIVLDLRPEHDFGDGVDNGGEVARVVDGRLQHVKEADLEKMEPCGRA